MASFAGILAQVAEKGTAYQRREFDPKSVMGVADLAAREFQRENMNLLSCYELDGDYGLHMTLGRFCKANKPADKRIEAAIEAGDEQALFAAFLFALRSAFVILYQRNALKRLQLIDKWPEEAQREYTWIHDVIVAAAPVASTPVVSVAPAVPVETPVETCAREFKEMPSDKFRAKWINHQGNRAIYEQACDEGKI